MTGEVWFRGIQKFWAGAYWGRIWTLWTVGSLEWMSSVCPTTTPTTWGTYWQKIWSSFFWRQGVGVGVGAVFDVDGDVGEGAVGIDEDGFVALGLGRAGAAGLIADELFGRDGAVEVDAAADDAGPGDAGDGDARRGVGRRGRIAGDARKGQAQHAAAEQGVGSPIRLKEPGLILRRLGRRRHGAIGFHSSLSTMRAPRMSGR